MKHYDFFGRELMVGDRVAYIDSKYQELRNGEILKLNEKQATIRNLDDDDLDAPRERRNLRRPGI